MTSTAVPVLSLLGLPLLGAVATGGGLGPVYALSSVLAAVATAPSSGRPSSDRTGTAVLVMCRFLRRTAPCRLRVAAHGLLAWDHASTTLGNCMVAQHSN
jgi:hypothetical protein